MKKLTALAFGIAVAVSLTGCGSLSVLSAFPMHSQRRIRSIWGFWHLKSMWKRSWETNMRFRYFQMNF
jgi:hypothetical protein